MKKQIIISLLLSIGINGFVSAQKEIPDKIKDKIVNGIKYLENSKVPEDIDKAVKEFSEAAAIAPEYPDVHYYLGKTLSMMQGNAGKAQKELKKYLDLFPGAPDKDKVNEEIAALGEIIKSKRKSSLLGAEFISTRDGIYVRYLYPFSPANKQFRVGDKITRVDKKKIPSSITLQNFLQLVDNYPSSNIPVSVIRGGVTSDLIMNKAVKTSEDNIKELGEEDLNDLIANSAKPMVVVFWVDWSEPCRKYALILRDMAKGYSNTVTFVSVSLDENMTIGKEFGIAGFPTTLFYKNGKLSGKIIGNKPDLLKDKISTIQQISEPFGLNTTQTAVSDTTSKHLAEVKYTSLDIKFPQNTSLSKMGFGWQVVKEGVKVVMPFPNLPAEKLGMKKGDLIVKVNEKSVENISQTEFKELLSNNKAFTFEIKRRIE